jgi:PAS domain S-box-containing protein
LDERGFIHHCNGPTERMFGYSCCELKGRHISALFPQLADTELICGEHVNPRLKFLCHCGTPFRGIRRDGETVLTELYLNKLGSVSGPSLVVIVRGVEPRSQVRAENETRIGGSSVAGL